MDVLLIHTGHVDNCISADSIERAQQYNPGHTCLERTPELAHVGPGWGWDIAGFTAPPEPPRAPRGPITRLEFLQRIPANVRIQIRTRAKLDPVIEDAMALLDAATEVDTDHPDTIQLVMYLRMQGLLSDEQAAAVLGG